MPGPERERPTEGQCVAAAAMVLPSVHEAGVDAERDVVEEQALPGSADVDPALNPVERGQRCERIVTVEADVAREVVSGAEGDADERKLPRERDVGDRCQRPVAARDPDRAGRSLRRECRRVVAGLQDACGHTAPAGLREQVADFDAVTDARVRVDEQEARHSRRLLGRAGLPGTRAAVSFGGLPAIVRA